MKKVITLIFLIVFFSCEKEEAIPIDINFFIDIVDGDYSVPVKMNVNNTTVGADTYNWIFEGGIPNSSDIENPNVITFNSPGEYVIKLEASNQDGIKEIKEIPITIYPNLEPDYDITIIDNNFPPMEIQIVNNTLGANSYNWSFNEGLPQSSTNSTPQNIIFNSPGTKVINLEVSNGFEIFNLEKTVTVAPHLNTVFDYEVAFQDDDFQVPVTLTMDNQSISATTYSWKFQGGNPATSNEEHPEVIYELPGTYTIQLEASNGKETQTYSKSITVYPDKNLRHFENIELGINTAHTNNSIGAFFSTITREVYSKDEVNVENGEFIDIVFFGLNENFTYNKFISPINTQNFTFTQIPNATDTKIINSQENSSLNITPLEFDQMENGNLLSSTQINETPLGLEEFDDSVLPRVVLFETNAGKKGAIKIKEYINNGENSFIIVDIKITKN